ncbi:MAG: transcriptional repressor [Negativicoccus succinicivorans]|nr:transcriptional repressor [Negativicoccus succinicivorans]
MRQNEIMRTLREKIKEHKYKFTTQRQDILKVFVESDENHMSAEDVFNAVKVIQPDIGLATVYRTLDLFVELGLLKKLDFGDGRSRYELFDDNMSHFHHHLICLGCGAIKEFEYDMLDPLEQIIEEEERFQIVDHVLKFYGYCRKCRRKQRRI